MPLARLLLGCALAAGPVGSAVAQTIERLYVMDCGHIAGKDESHWSPGINVGKPIGLSENCYLMKHGTQWLLLDTGFPDAVTDAPFTEAIGTITRSKKLATQLAELNLKPADIAYLALTHTHHDHIGNVDMFPTSTLLIQKAEVDWAFAAGKDAPFKKDRPMKELTGDFDVFGDGSAILLQTPGHTPGHQSMLLHLAKTGWVVLTGDLAHFRYNWDHDIAPPENTSAAETHASHARIAKVLADKSAQLWINHDQPTTDSQKHSPQFYD